MSEKKPLLDETMITRKGEATPSPKKSLPRGTTNTIPVTVRLDKDRYGQLTEYSSSFFPRKTHQEIIVTALDQFFSVNK